MTNTNATDPCTAKQVVREIENTLVKSGMILTDEAKKLAHEVRPLLSQLTGGPRSAIAAVTISMRHRPVGVLLDRQAVLGATSAVRLS